MGQLQSRQLVQNTRFENVVQFTINGQEYKISDEIPGDTSLNTFIREYAGLKGTKYMCLEGGCGSCVVTVESTRLWTGNTRTYAVNSCLIPIFVCQGWSITTIEGLGSEAAGYHDIQKRLAAASGTQCGFCSSGMIMNMHSLLETHPKLSMKQIENSFGGNICRCTGYRPILDAFKSFAIDCSSELVKKLVDIEDTHLLNQKRCDGVICGNKCTTFCFPPHPVKSRTILTLSTGQMWYRPVSIKEIFEILDLVGDTTYRFLCGNTGQGVYRITEPQSVIIDLNGVGELYVCSVNNEAITLGANISINEAMEFFYKASGEQPTKYSYCKVLADHMDLIANVPVRNVGSIAGNLSLKHEHPEFPSDVFLLLETVGASVTIKEATGVERTICLGQYIETNMNQKLMVNVILPPYNEDVFVLRTYKIMPRAQNAHAYVNSGFFFNLDKNDGYKVTDKPRIVYGGINPQFVHADQTENFLIGKQLSNSETLKGAILTLTEELIPNHTLPDASADYRKGLAISLFYKFILSLNSNIVNETLKSGGSLLERGVSKGSQDFDVKPEIWPLNKPMPKLEGLLQCSGEAEYCNDIPSFPNQVWAQLVLCDQAVGYIESIDASEALRITGVIAFFDHNDIPGENYYYRVPGNIQDKIFSDGKTNYAGQAVGVIVAETHSLAITAAKKVKINYSKVEPPILNVCDVVEKQMSGRIHEFASIKPTRFKDNVKFKVTGKWNLKTQYHFTMETLTCIVVPTETYYEVYAATQHPETVQIAISRSLKIPANKINVNVRRLGGGYGAKIDRTNHTSVVCALAAHSLHRPVRMVLNLETNMEWMGKRVPNLCKYEAGVSDLGEIQYLKASIYQDHGNAPSQFISVHSLKHVGNCYDIRTFNVKMFGVLTDNAWSTWCRAPGSTEQISMMENIMEHIAKVVKKDPIDVRLINIVKGSELLKIIKDTKTSTNYSDRLKEVDDFNRKNRWKKRGINLSAMSYGFYYRAQYHAHVTIYSDDGSVLIAHGGVEMGQGINTKAVQVAAKYLGIGVEMISVSPLRTSESPNNSRTGGCQATDSVCYAIVKCCQELNRRLEPFKTKLGPKANWASIIKAAHLERVNLRHSYMFTPKDNVKPYNIYGVVVTEIELDVLTGQFQILRVDLTEDAGQSINPTIDVGQVEGAFVMGLGYYTSEEIVYNPKTGAILTNRTWNYKPPGAKDIPSDFRVTLRKRDYNAHGVLGSKATGEPPFCLSCSVVFAIRNAVTSARQDAGLDELWFEMELPLTAERIWLACRTSTDSFVF